MAVATDYTNTQYQAPPYMPCSPRASPAALNSEWGKMVTRADLTPRYQGVTSAGPRAPDPMAPPSNTGVYATMHPISKEPELSNTSDSTNGHFQRCYTALQKRSADYEKQRLQLAQNIAYRYPNPGMPRSKQGRVGGSWRHIKEVLGYGGSRVVFVDGLVRLYDEETGDSGRVTSRPVTPLYAPNRHDVASYSRVLQREREQQAYKPWTSANTTATSGQRPGTTTQSGDPDSNQRYRGFYSYN